ncbi:hypothetical protein GOB93_01255 [Acetobacter musti]|uniref:Transposase n=1 Tax=Acetobacter musti TaxID=864732 RepID=A0ABX0JKB7_9PROT|nr:hypothetical protein [Acetobacter musti]NHN83269.1 hypothetical protein [Acetobacter musti]
MIVRVIVRDGLPLFQAVSWFIVRLAGQVRRATGRACVPAGRCAWMAVHRRGAGV